MKAHCNLHTNRMRSARASTHSSTHATRCQRSINDAGEGMAQSTVERVSTTHATRSAPGVHGSRRMRKCSCESHTVSRKGTEAMYEFEPRRVTERDQIDSNGVGAQGFAYDR
jgi:hypothetical protein